MQNVKRSRLGVECLSAALVGLVCAGGCASTGARPRPFPTPAPRVRTASPESVAVPPEPVTPPDTPVEAAAAPRSAFDPYALAGTALALRGTPYRNGGADPHGFDCSGFTQYVFAQYGISLPRAVLEQFGLGAPVGAAEIAPGDLLFFTTVAPGASHVAIAIGGDQFVHAPSSTGVVRIERASSAYWAPRFLAARRVWN